MGSYFFFSHRFIGPRADESQCKNVVDFCVEKLVSDYLVYYLALLGGLSLL